MNRPVAAVTVGLAAPLAGIAAGIATHNGDAIAIAFAACLVAAPIISPPKGPTA